MREGEFVVRLTELLQAHVVGLDHSQRNDLLRSVFNEALDNSDTAFPVCRVVPFVTGRRPTDAAAHPGLGSSDNAAMIGATRSQCGNETYILYTISGFEHVSAEECASFALDVTLSFAATDGAQETLPIPGWNRRPIEPHIFANDPDGTPALRAISLCEAAGQDLVIGVSPDKDLLPGTDWSWESLDERVRAAATDVRDPFSFGHLFTQMVYVCLRLTHHGTPVSATQSMIDVCDTRRFGSLYQRIVDKLIEPDTARQSVSANASLVDKAFHPWFPVLAIGAEKAALYTDALVEDIVCKKRYLTDPRWLMRVGLYLEFLTCIGIFEAVKDDVGDVLTPHERRAYESSPLFAEIRKRLNPQGWRKVWDLRGMVFPQVGVPQAGPVSALNLLQKKKATLAFLKVHHDDLKNALELAGRNEYSAQETWQRVFRDAERAVLRKTSDAFPELSHLDAKLRNFVLWHQKGRLHAGGLRWMPEQLSSFFGDQDGLFVSACTQYRASMNEVAEWAKHRGIMDYTGDECVPRQVSLLQAHLGGQTAQMERLQRRDGFAASLDDMIKLPPEPKRPIDAVYRVLGDVAPFRMLTSSERRHLAETVREIVLGPTERIIVEGREGSSLFVVVEGSLEVLARQANGVDKQIAIINRGHVIGEIALLTGTLRTATVRALDGAVVYEIGKEQYGPLIRARPEILDALVVIMEDHMRGLHEYREAYAAEKETAAIRERIRKFFLGA